MTPFYNSQLVKHHQFGGCKEFLYMLHTEWQSSCHCRFKLSRMFTWTSSIYCKHSHIIVMPLLEICQLKSEKENKFAGYDNIFT